MALSPSKIDYLTHVWSLLIGCLHGCEYCFARERVAPRMRHRCKLCGDYVPHMHWERVADPAKRVKPARIGLGFMADVFGDWDWQDPDRPEEAPLTTAEYLWNAAFNVMRRCPQHRFIVLTKNPAGIPTDVELPDNLWVGTSITGATGVEQEEDARLEALRARVPTGRRIVSWEPFEGRMLAEPGSQCWHWVILGGRTGKDAHGIDPVDVRHTQNECAEYGIPLFVKANAGVEGAPQEYPEGLVLPWEPSVAKAMEDKKGNCRDKAI